jgi:hypothetical protein
MSLGGWAVCGVNAAGGRWKSAGGAGGEPAGGCSTAALPATLPATAVPGRASGTPAAGTPLPQAAAAPPAAIASAGR